MAESPPVSDLRGNDINGGITMKFEALEPKLACLNSVF